jgi:hypothetical protein
MIHFLQRLCGLLLMVLSAATTVSGQARIYHRLDTMTLKNVSQFSSADLVHTGLPGREYALAGTVTGADSTGRFHQSVFLLHLDTLGMPFRYDEFEDQALFLFQGPKAYGLCYDGQSAFYIGTGSNNRQLVIKADTSGDLDWALAQHHHEFYSLLCDGAGVTFLGQDESQAGAHDFSISHFTQAGGDGFGAMHGTTGFEVPERLVHAAGGGFLLAGQTSLNNTFLPMLLRVESDYDLIWGKMYTIPGKRGFIKDIVAAPNGSGYVAAGMAQGQGGIPDSLLMVKVDTAGNLLWAKIYGGPQGMEMQGINLEVRPDGQFFVGLTARDTGYRYPALLRMDANGTVLVARSLDDADPNTEEALTSMSYDDARKRLYIAGDRTTVTPTFQIIKDILVMHVAEDLRVGCDTTFAVGSRSVTMTDSSGWLYEPYQVIDTTMEFGAWPGQVLADTACSYEYLLVIGQPDGLPPYALSYANPASSNWRVSHTLPLGGATLEWVDLQGRVLLQRPLPAGQGDTELNLDGMADGLYLVRLRGQDWMSRAERVLLIRH